MGTAALAKIRRSICVEATLQRRPIYVPGSDSRGTAQALCQVEGSALVASAACVRVGSTVTLAGHSAAGGTCGEEDEQQFAGGLLADLLLRTRLPFAAPSRQPFLCRLWVGYELRYVSMHQAMVRSAGLLRGGAGAAACAPASERVLPNVLLPLRLSSTAGSRQPLLRPVRL